MSEALAIPLILLLGIFLVAGTRRFFDEREAQLIVVCYIVHIISAVLQVVITVEYYGGGDMTNYILWSRPLLRWLDLDPDRAWPQAIAMAFRQPAHIPFEVYGGDSSTGAMNAITAIAFHLLGRSLYTVCLACSTLAFSGQLALYVGFRRMFPEGSRAWIQVAAMLVPSVVFWSSGLLKEAFALTGLGWIILGLTEPRGRWRYTGPVLIVSGLVLCALFKSYVLFPLVVAMGVYVYWSRAVARSGGASIEVRPISLAIAIAFAIGGVMALGEIFPSYSLTRFSAEAARLHRLGGTVGGGSYYSVGSLARLGFWGQMALAPFALLSALFRPFPFEIRNPFLLVNGIETMGLAAVAARAISKQSWGRIWERVRASPGQMMSLVFVITFGAAVGLVTTNIGSLSRYRIPMMPFFVALVVCWVAPVEAHSRAAARALPPAAPPPPVRPRPIVSPARRT